jgi:hypothetical protein
MVNRVDIAGLALLMCLLALLKLIGDQSLVKQSEARIIEEIRISRAETESVHACIDSLLERGHFIYWGDERECK